MPALIDLGIVDFESGLALQEAAVRRVSTGGREVVFLLEHPPVYTIGRSGSLANVLDPDVRPHRINRGGDVTFHGPGQLVIYPILNLGRRGRDVHLYLRLLEELVLLVGQNFEISVHTVPGRTGVWTATGKLAAVGVGVRRWISMHGCAVNVSASLECFRQINPCGLVGCQVTSLSGEAGREIGLGEVKAVVGAIFPWLVAERLPVRD